MKLEDRSSQKSGPGLPAGTEAAFYSFRIDVNELSKCLAYLRSVVHLPDAGSRFFRFTGELVRETGLHRSNETPRYYRLIDQTCKKYLQSLQDRPAEMLQILGWAARLARYYRNGGVPIGEIPSPPDPNGGRPTHSRGGEAKPQPEALREQKQAQPQVENAAVSTKTRFKIGQHLKARITNIKGNEVTFQIVDTDIKLTQKEPKRAGSLTVGQEVEVEVLDLREDGRVRRVRLL